MKDLACSIRSIRMTFSFEIERLQLFHILSFVGKIIYFHMHIQNNALYAYTAHRNEYEIVIWWQTFSVGEIQRILRASKTHVSMIRSINEYWWKLELKRSAHINPIGNLRLPTNNVRVFYKGLIKFTIFNHCSPNCGRCSKTKNHLTKKNSNSLERITVAGLHHLKLTWTWN